MLFSYLHTGPTKRNHIKEGLLWWDLNKKQVEVPSERRVSSTSQAYDFGVLLFYFYCFICVASPTESRNVRKEEKRMNWINQTS